MSVYLEVESLIQGLQQRDPRLYQALQRLNTQLNSVSSELEPLVRQSTLEPGTVSDSLAAPISFSASFPGASLRLNWSSVDGASQYEIRYGTNWDTAYFVLRSTSLQADIDPIAVGSHTYLIKSVTSGSIYSSNTTTLVVAVSAIPGVTLNAQVIDNNVLLRWTAPSSLFNIRHYVIYTNGTLVGFVTSTFFTLFETTAGVYNYSVVAVDIAGNESSESTISVTVASPPDYDLQEEIVSALDGARTNVLMLPGPKLLASWAAASFEQHFVSRSWLSPQNQVSAGYPIYLQPSTINGAYQEDVDYGGVFNNVIISINWNYNLWVPTEAVGIVVRMSTSIDGLDWTDSAAGSIQFARTLRYLRFWLEFTASNDQAFIEIFNLTIRLDVKREHDGGRIEALATDADGTEVVFNKSFKDVESITATVAASGEPFTVVRNFDDVPNPTSFFVFVFDSAGNRVTKIVDWKARGIV